MTRITIAELDGYIEKASTTVTDEACLLQDYLLMFFRALRGRGFVLNFENEDETVEQIVEDARGNSIDEYPDEYPMDSKHPILGSMDYDEEGENEGN